MNTLIVHTKSESACSQCDMTLKTAEREGIDYVERPGIDTADRTPELLSFKQDHGLSSAPIVEAVSATGVVLDRWAGFRPDKIKEYAS